MAVRIITGDCRDVLRTLPDESVHCVVTSPPYWGLRDYGVAGQIGIEFSVQEHLALLVNVFRDMRRVLRKDGVFWLNYGDAYANDGKSGGETGGKQAYLDEATRKRNGREKRSTGLKPKDRMMLPARLAIALQTDGWWLRDEIVWHKPNPMPSSVADRTTPAHEMIYLLTRSARYYYDADAIKEPASWDPGNSKMPDGWDTGPGSHGSFHRAGREKGARTDKQLGHSRQHAGFNERWDAMERKEQCSGQRNKRSVWTVGTQGFPEAHFATFPPALIEPCIKAGCPVDGTVLDPFGGAGTTGVVADRLQRNAILIELNPEYAAMAERRINGDAPLFAQVRT